MRKTDGALLLAQEWLQQHSASRHTRRKYESQLQQFCEWMLVRGHDFGSIQPLDIERYLAEVAAGEASTNAHAPGVPRSSSTLALTRSALRSLFRWLMVRGFRTENPVDLAQFPREVPTERGAEDVEQAAAQSWLTLRRQAIPRVKGDHSARNALARALAIGELAYWAGLRRSELAAAVMSDFSLHEKQWWLRVQRFGRGDRDEVEIPPPAVDALALYRLSRGLTALPQPHERDVPLVSRLRAEHSVEPWTVVNALKALQVLLTATGAERIAPLRLMRRQMVEAALDAQVPSHDLERHVRSKNLVDQLVGFLPRHSISDALQKVAA